MGQLVTDKQTERWRAALIIIFLCSYLYYKSAAYFFEKLSLNSPKTEMRKLLNKKAVTYTSAILTLSSPTDDVFDFLQIITKLITAGND